MTAQRERQPSHPGSLLREVVLPTLSVSIAQAAREMGVSRQQLYMILREERAITAEMAMRLGKYCGNGAELWLNMQAAHDLWKVRSTLADEIAAIPTRAAG